MCPIAYRAAMDDVERTRRLRQMKRRATGLLVVVTVVFLAIAALRSDALTILTVGCGQHPYLPQAPVSEAVADMVVEVRSL